MILPEHYPRYENFLSAWYQQIGQSEEHLVVECLDSGKYKIGDICYAIPQHVCPTVPKYNKVITVENNQITGSWKGLQKS